MMLSRISAPLVVLLLVSAPETVSQPLSEAEMRERMEVFGADFLVEVLEPPVIDDPSLWLSRREGEYVYRIVLGADDGEVLQKERHVPDPDEPTTSWERHVGDRLIESFMRTDDRDVVIVEEIDHRFGFRIEISPGVHWPAGMAGGEEWRVVSDLAVFRLDSDDPFKHGKLTSTLTYEGAFRVRTPAGEFDTILLREDFVLDIGPLAAEDDRFLFFAEGVGLVAEIEGVKASALLLFHLHEDSAKVLESRPEGGRPSTL